MLTITSKSHKYETDEDYHSRTSPFKMGWRLEEMNVFEQFMGSVPKGQYVALLAGRFMLPNGTIDPTSEVALLVKRGICKLNQIFAIDGSADVVKGNAKAEKFGIKLFCGDFATVINRLAPKYAFAIVSADFMKTYITIADEVASLMNSLNKHNQPAKALLYINASLIIRKGEYAGKLDEDVEKYLRRSEDFRIASTDKRSDFPCVWNRQRFFKDNADHVTRRAPMKSCLFVKESNPNFGKRLRLSKSMKTRIGLNPKVEKPKQVHKASNTRLKNLLDKPAPKRIGMEGRPEIYSYGICKKIASRLRCGYFLKEIARQGGVPYVSLRRAMERHGFPTHR